MTTPSPRAKEALASIHVKSYMGPSHAVVEVLEPSGKVADWILPSSLLPRAARQHSEFAFKQGDHVLFTEQQMPLPVEVPFWRLLGAQKRGRARRSA